METCENIHIPCSSWLSSAAPQVCSLFWAGGQRVAEEQEAPIHQTRLEGAEAFQDRPLEEVGEAYRASQVEEGEEAAYQVRPVKAAGVAAYRLPQVEVEAVVVEACQVLPVKEEVEGAEAYRLPQVEEAAAAVVAWTSVRVEEEEEVEEEDQCRGGWLHLDEVGVAPWKMMGRGVEPQARAR